MSQAAKQLKVKVGTLRRCAPPPPLHPRPLAVGGGEGGNRDRCRLGPSVGTHCAVPTPEGGEHTVAMTPVLCSSIKEGKEHMTGDAS